MNDDISIKMPSSMGDAGRALRNIGNGQGTEADLLAIFLAINKSPTKFGRIIGADEIERGMQEMIDIAKNHMRDLKNDIARLENRKRKI